MTLLFIDSFDHYTTITRKYEAVSGGSIQAVGRNSTDAWRGNLGHYIQKSVTQGDTFTVGFAFQYTAVVGNQRMFSFYDLTTEQLWVRMDAGGSFTIRRGSTDLETTSFTCNEDTWYFFEFQATINNSTGSYELRIDGDTKASDTGLDTQNGTNAYANRVRITAPVTYLYVDDLYICDDSGSENNDFLGDVRVEAILPSGAGNSAEWEVYPSGSNYTVVDEEPPNDDTDYVLASGVGDEDTYAFGNLVTTDGSIFGVQITPCARKDDAGYRSFCNLMYINSTTYSGEAQYIGDSYNFYPEIIEDNPDTTADWTISDVNGAEFGARMSS